MVFTPQENSVLTQVNFDEFISDLDVRELLLMQSLAEGSTVSQAARSLQVSRRYAHTILHGLRVKFDSFFDSHLES